MADYRTEKELKAGKKTYRVVKVNAHIQVFDANSKADNPKPLYDNETDKQPHFFRWWRAEAKKQNKPK